MLRLIMGTAGTGKTTAVYDRIVHRVRDNGKPAILIVPEQFSFESERTLCRLLGEKLALNVQVLSFTRLCHKIFYAYGQAAGQFIDQTGRYLLMSLAIEQVRDQLTLYQAQAARASFVPVVLDLVGELKNAGASAGCVLSASQRRREQNGKLADKLRELALIYQSYQALVERAYRDPADNIERALALSAGRGFFLDTAVYIDSFTAFMAPEMRFIAQMLGEAEEVSVTACCPGLGQEGARGDDVFSPVRDTVRKLISAANRAGTPVVSPVVLTGTYKRSGPLAHLERCYLQQRELYPAGQDAVRCVAAGDIADEARYIAREIVSLVHDHGYRYREIAVITRNLAPYEQPIGDIFAAHRIPACFDRRENVESFEVMNLVLCALLSVKGGFDTQQLASLSKIPLLGIAQEDAFELENYCFVWNVRGRLWQHPFCNHPDGLESRGMTDAARERLGRIERARAVLMAPLTALRDALRVPSGESFARGVYQYLEDCGALARLREQSGIEALAEYVDVQSALFDSLIDILDLFYSLLGKQRFTLTRLIELWRLAVQSCDVGKLPQTLDQVIVGTADRIRPSGIRAAFVCGAEEGAFPLRFSGSGLLSDQEREELRETGTGLSLNVAKTDLARLERFYTYFAVSVPAERLMITYPTRSTGGEEKRPSVIVRTVQELFADCMARTAEQDPLRGVLTRANAFSLLCGVWREPTPLREALRGYFEGSAELERLTRSLASVEDKNFSIEDRSVARRLFGRLLALSPSRLEKYYGCAFAYFCEGGLRLKKRRRVEFSPLESGSLAHYVLEVLVRKYCRPPADTENAAESPAEDSMGSAAGFPADAALRKEIAALINDYLSERIEDPSMVDKRFKYLFTRLCGTLARLARRLAEEFSQSAFRPFAFELSIDPQSGNKPVVLETPGGNRVYVRGVVDRVDLLESAEGRFLRVVDYKSGSKTFHLADVYYGLNMQMLVYLFTLTQNGEKALRGAFPAGVLYMPARDTTLTVERAASGEAIDAMRADSYKMNGLLLDNVPVLARMEKNLSGMFIPAKLKKDGTLDSLSKVAALEEFGRLRRHIETLIGEMADSLIEGRVGALPASGLGYDPCGLCDYKAICRREERHPCRTLADLKKEELFALLRKEEEEKEETEKKEAGPHGTGALDAEPARRH